MSHSKGVSLPSRERAPGLWDYIESKSIDSIESVGGAVSSDGNGAQVSGRVSRILGILIRCLSGRPEGVSRSFIQNRIGGIKDWEMILAALCFDDVVVVVKERREKGTGRGKSVRRVYSIAEDFRIKIDDQVVLETS